MADNVCTMQILGVSHESTLADIRAFAPVEFRRWVLGGISLTVVGYVTTGIMMRWQQGPHLSASLISSGVAALCMIGLLLAARGREMLGITLALTAVWCEVQTGFARMGYFPSAGLAVLPVVIVGFGMLMGARRALVAVIVSVFATVLSVWLSAPSRPSGFDAQSKYALVLYAIAMGSAWVVVTLSTRGFQRTVRELVAKERDLADTIRFSPDGILVLDGVQRVVLANPAAQRILGVELGELVGNAIADVLRAAASNGTDLIDASPRDTGEAPVAMRFTTRAGLVTHAEAIWHRMEGDRRQLLLRDVTERVHADERRREIEAQLAHAQRLEAVGQLAGGLSHDFNNILTAVSGSAELLRDETNPQERLALLDEILAAGDRGAGLTRQLLAFARRDVLQPQVIDLAVHIASLQRLFQRVLGDEARLILARTGECRVLVDPGLLEQALINLVANARDAMTGGGNCTISVNCVVSESGVRTARLSVSDEGVGMAPEVAARAFEPFYTTKPRGQGTGLGLASVHGMVTQSGGTAEIVSQLGHGTQVTLEFPCVSDAVAPTVTLTRAPQRANGTLRVLLAEDDESTRAVVERMLRQSGYDVVSAHDGLEALRVLESEGVSFDILLTDVMMPGLTGPALALRARERHPRMPVLFMTGYADTEMAATESESGEKQVIAKPFSMHALVERLTQMAQPSPIAPPT